MKKHIILTFVVMIILAFSCTDAQLFDSKKLIHEPIILSAGCFAECQSCEGQGDKYQTCLDLCRSGEDSLNCKSTDTQRLLEQGGPYVTRLPETDGPDPDQYNPLLLLLRATSLHEITLQYPGIKGEEMHTISLRSIVVDDKFEASIKERNLELVNESSYGITYYDAKTESFETYVNTGDFGKQKKLVKLSFKDPMALRRSGINLIQP